ncbi:MAG TPA: lipopolysaccharide biosynthesis protein [Dongiaceae bacterium]|jgi:O-antigen/teichoic acid export membrane protein|nr:lipopolysaccharide biosynthesis protein [Dongiaceae bacterium]
MTVVSGEPPVLEKKKGRADLTNPTEPEDDEPSLYNEDLRKKTRSSILWTVVRIASDQMFSFIVFVILARLLSPREVGVFAIAVAFSEAGRVIAIQGMVQNIPRAKKLTPALADTVFWTNLAMSVIVALVVLALAPLIMDLIDQPDSAAPLQALGFVLPIAALGATHLSLRLREFGHKSLALRSVMSGTIGGAAAIAAAFAGWGIWSLVVQRFVTESVNAAMSWHAYRWIPGRNFSMAQLRTIWSFGFNIALTQLIGLMPRRAMDLVLGTIIGPAAVGIYRTAVRTTELVSSGTIAPYTTVALQTLSRLQTDTKEMAKAYRWMVSRSAMLTIPAMVGFGVLARDAVPAIYGEKWAEAGQVAQTFACLAVSYSISSFASPLLMALGRGSTLRTLVFGQVIATVVVAALSAPFGVLVVAWTSVIRGYMALPFTMWMLKRASGITPLDSLSAIAKPLSASLIMGVAVWCLMEIIRPYFSHVLVPVFICVGAGMLIYAVAILAISSEARKLVRSQLKTVRARLKK